MTEQFANIITDQFEDQPEKREALPDECQAMGESISDLASVIDELENRLSFVLLSQYKDEKTGDAFPELGPGRSDSSSLIREYRTRLIYLTQGLRDIVKRLDL